MEAILTRIHYSHAEKNSGLVTAKHIEVPPGSSKTISIGRSFRIKLENSIEPTCQWKSNNETDSSEPGWNNQQFTIPIKRGVVKVLTVYRDAIDTPHQDH